MISDEKLFPHTLNENRARGRATTMGDAENTFADDFEPEPGTHVVGPLAHASPEREREREREGESHHPIPDPSSCFFMYICLFVTSCQNPRSSRHSPRAIEKNKSRFSHPPPPLLPSSTDGAPSVPFPLPPFSLLPLQSPSRGPRDGARMFSATAPS